MHTKTCCAIGVAVTFLWCHAVVCQEPTMQRIPPKPIAPAAHPQPSLHTPKPPHTHTPTHTHTDSHPQSPARTPLWP